MKAIITMGWNERCRDIDMSMYVKVAYCNCRLESKHPIDNTLPDEDEILKIQETKYIFVLE